MVNEENFPKCIVMFTSGFFSFTASLMMLICLLFTKRINELEKVYLTVQLVFVNLLTCLSIIVYPFMNFISKNYAKCQVDSLLTTCLIVVTFGLKLTIFCTRHQDMRNNLKRIKLNMSEISPRWVKLFNVIIWLVPIGMLVAVFVYFPQEMPLKFIYKRINCNYTMSTELQLICFIPLVQNALLSALYILVTLFLLILAYQIILMHHKANKHRGVIGYHQIRQESQLRNKLFLEVFLFALWWAPVSTWSMYNVVCYILNQEPTEVTILIYMQLFTSPSQGTIDLILFVLGFPQLTKYPNMILTRHNVAHQSSSDHLLPEYATSENKYHSLRSGNEHVISVLSSSFP